MPLYQLGEEIVFETATLVPQSVNRKRDWRWAVQERMQRAPARQAIGEGDDIVTFSGVIFPSFNPGGKPVGRKQLDKIEAAGSKFEPLLLNDGTGKIWGRYCILDISEDRELFMENGAPRKQSYSITLGKYFDDESGIGGGVDGGIGGGVSTDGMTGSNNIA